MGTANSRPPVRTCVGCRRRFAQSALVRYVRAGAPETAWQRDRGRARGPGRGAYLCSLDCAARVRKNRRYPGLADATEAADFAVGAGPCMIEQPPKRLEQTDMK